MNHELASKRFSANRRRQSLSSDCGCSPTIRSESEKLLSPPRCLMILPCSRRFRKWACSCRLFSKAVMVQPAGINGERGMEYALRKLGLSPHEAIGIDAESYHAFLEY